MRARPAAAAAKLAISAIAAATVGLAGASCEGEAGCEEDARAQVLDRYVELEVAGLPLRAELADDEASRERGWMHRRCDLEAILLVPDAGAEVMSVWGCGLAEPLSIGFVANGSIVEKVDALRPCGNPELSGPASCTGCPLATSPVPVDGVLEVPEGSFEFEVGDQVLWVD